MKNVLAMLLLAFALVLPGHAGQKEAALLDGLLGIGLKLVDSQADKPEAEGADKRAARPKAAPTHASQPVALGLTGSLKKTLDELIDSYKEEGRAYARELGDVVVARVVQDPEINTTITSLRALCWAVIAYLTLVTLIMLGCLLYLKRSNAHLLAEVKRLTSTVNE